MYKKLLIAFLLPFALYLVPLPAAEWYGYYESEANIFSLPDNDYSFVYHKFNLDMDASPSENLRFSTSLVYKNYFGNKTFLMDDFIHPDYMPISFQWQFYIPLQDTLYWKSMALDIYTKFADITIGKQQISPGCGYAWNPADIFNTKDVMDPTYEQNGVQGLSIKSNFPLDILMTYHTVIDGPFDSAPHMLILKKNISGMDISANIIIVNNPTYYNAELYKERTLAGMTMEADIFGLGLRMEYEQSFLKDLSGKDITKVEFVIGTDWTFSNSLYLMLEYFHNDFGVESEEVDFNHIMASFSGIQRSLNRDYLFTYMMFPLTDLSSLSLAMISNLNDGSSSINPQVDVSIYQNLDLQWMISLPIGPDKSEFAYQKWGTRLRLSAYF
ncbi:MAG: hypothetical protein KAI81_09735 [Candidatus Marinimicrobia bacterium]|nr:hypothetical protein [Candidatus Neomarinimicrobiota bacterium]